MSSFPHRPPRRSGASGSTRSDTGSAGLLVSAVRTLTTSASSDQRELEKLKLENGFQETGKIIEALVATHQEDLTASLQSFRKVSTRITAARERIRSVKNNLSSCKSLLQCKRDELRKLWLENAEQKHVAEILRQVETIRRVPTTAMDQVSQKHFLKAAELLHSANGSLEGDLVVVDGLREMKEEIRRISDSIFTAILEQMHRLIYLRPTETLVEELQKGGSGVFRRSTGSLTVQEDDSPVLRDNGCAYEDEQETEPEQNPVQYLAVLCEALAVLGRVPEAVHQLRHRVQHGLSRLMHHSLAAFYSSHLEHGSEQTMGLRAVGDGRLLAEFLQLLFRQFRVVSVLHQLLLAQIQRVVDARGISAPDVYEMTDMWAQIQVALQQLLGEYLDVRGVHAGVVSGRLATETAPSALTSFFVKKRPARARRPTLFRFDATTHAINVSTFAKEQKALDTRFSFSLSSLTQQGAELVWICPPAAENVTSVFRPLTRFLSEVENKVGGPCQLRTFLEDYVRSVFLPRMENELRELADVALQSADAWQTVVGGEEQNRLEAPVPVLASTARTMDLCRRVEGLMQALPPFADRLAALWLLVLGEYQRRIQNVYEQATRSVRQPEGAEPPTEWRKISAAWAVDEDISRLLKSLPNWTTLMNSSEKLNPTTPFSPPTAPVTPVESSAEIRKRNQRESEILIGNLGTQKKIEEWEIIQDLVQIRSLTNIHESLEWFCAAIRRSLGNLPAPTIQRLKQAQVEIATVASDQPPTVENLSSGFERHLCSLEEMAETCLLMLHLEVRVHCFYHLLPLARHGSHVVGAAQSQEAAPAVLALNRQLVQLHELLGAQLQRHKLSYVFEGLGHLVSQIFIHSAQHISKINDNGKKRMCRNIFALQQCLSGLSGSREPDLDTARKFFELLYRTPDDIISGISEHGQEFGQLEYQYIVSLALRSNPALSTEPGALEARLSKLRRAIAQTKTHNN